MSLETYAALIETFGRSIGLEGAAPDAEGYCAMSFDELVVHFQYDGEDDSLTLFARIGTADEDRLEGIYAMLLGANLFWQGTKGATLSVDPDIQAVFIADRRELAHLSDGLFRDWLGGFIDIAEHWTDRLATANAGGSLTGADDQPPPDEPGTEFMTRV